MDHFTGDMTQLGHFVLVTGVDQKKGTVSVYDGTTALYMRLTADRFAESWSGYFLQLKPRLGMKVVMGMISFLTAVVVFFLLKLGRKRLAAGARCS
jgi:ABC-type bacteriocin/lantibiotic exporter with double-glycine peptidase domain